MKSFRAFVVAVFVAAPSLALAQGGGEVTLRTGLVYAPDAARAVAVVPVKGGPHADSIGAIIQRDLDYSNRISLLRLSASDNALFYDTFKGLSYDFFAGLNANYVLEMTSTQAQLTVKVHEVTRRKAATVVDFSLPMGGLGRDWRMALHTASDSILAIITEGPRGVAATRIAYTRGQQLRMVDSDGANDVAVPADSNALSPAWDPTGTRIVYNTYGGDARIIVINLLTGQSITVQRKIWNTSPTTPVFAPDGNSIIYARSDDDSYSTVWRIPLNGGDPQRIDRGKGISSSPTLSPDGRRLAFMTDRLGHNEVYIIDADGSNPTWITQIAGDLNESAYRGEPDWSPDGITVAFQSRASGRFQIMTVNLRDNFATLLTNEGENQSPSWAPDGRHIVFTSSRSGSDQLWIMDTRSGVTRQLTNQSGAKYGAWSPRLPLRQ